MITKKTDIKFSSQRPLMISQYWGKNGFEKDKVSITYGEVPGDLFEKIHKEKSYKITDDKFLKKRAFDNVVDFKFEEGNVLVLVLSLAFYAYSDTAQPFPYPILINIEDSKFEQKKINNLKTLTINPSEYKDLQLSKYDYKETPIVATPIEEGECPPADPCSRVTFELDLPICIVKNGKLIQLISNIKIPIFNIFYSLEEINLVCATTGGGGGQSGCSNCLHPRESDEEGLEQGDLIQFDYKNWFGFFELADATIPITTNYSV